MGIALKLVLILFIELTLLSVIAAYFLINLQSAVVLLAFNVLFILVLHHLNDNLPLKLGLLATGNLIGLIWNFCFHQFMDYATVSLIIPNSLLNVFYAVAYPFLNSLWVISLWSLSLATLQNYGNYTRKYLS